MFGLAVKARVWYYRESMSMGDIGRYRFEGNCCGLVSVVGLIGTSVRLEWIHSYGKEGKSGRVDWAKVVQVTVIESRYS